MAMTSTTNDPILAKRARIASIVTAGKRIGYGLFGLAIILFFVGFATSWSVGLTTTIIVALLIGSVILAPAIIFGYGLRAAERADQGLSDGH